MTNHSKGLGLVLTFALGFITSVPSVNAVELNEKCVINILNRTVQVREDGGWALPNIPSNMGQIRARATCTLADGRTVSGQSDYFNVERNAVTRAGDIKFVQLDPIPTRLTFNSADTVTINDLAQTYALTVTAFYPDFSIKNVTAATSGINYSSTNVDVAAVSVDGVITPKTNGVVLISARKDGVLVSRRVAITLGGDLDNDGLPDEWERENGLNPNDPIDALEDHDKDGLSALQEFALGTDIHNADTDGDGISDKEESEPGVDGFVTSPLLQDSDGDGIADGLEITGGSNPNDSNSGSLSDYLDIITVTPNILSLTYNAIDGEASTQLKVTGAMLDGTEVDLTNQSSGTRYQTDNLRVANFGLIDGQIFAGENGQTKITVSNNGKTFVVDVDVSEFRPQAQTAISIPGYANNVDLQGELAFVAAGAAGLQIVDYTEINTPAIIGSLNTSGTAIDVKVSGQYAYVADGTAGLRIIDISEPTTPKLVSTADTAGVAQDVVLQNEFAYVADGSAGFEIFNVTDAEKPFSVGESDLIKDVKGIAVEGNHLVAVGGSALALFDVSNKSAPLRLSTVNIGPVQDVVIDNGYVYVAAYSSGYRVYKVTSANTLELKGGDRTFVPRDVAVTNGFAFFAEQLFPNVVAYLNIKAPDVPFFQDTIDLSPLGDYAGTGLALNATHAFVTEESHIVSSDYGTTGTTKLFSAQYRMLQDNNGIKPTVALTQPVSPSVTVEGARLILAADASDDIAVKKVEFFVNNSKVGEDTTAPYQMPYNVPFGVNAMAVSAKAIDLGGNHQRSAMATLEVQKDGDVDGLGNQQETDIYQTDPENPDSDGDGLLDGEEVARGINPNNADTDGDELPDGQEVDNGTDPNNPDVTAPLVAETEPAADAIDVAENIAVVVSFNEALQKKSISSASMKLLEGGTTEVAGSVRLIGDDDQLVFNAQKLLKDYTSYTVVISAIKDSAGNPLAASHQFDFVTGNTVDTVRPTVSSITPVHNSIDVPVNASVNLLMSERVDADTVTADSFYITDTTTNTRIEGVIDVKADSQTISFIPNAAFLIGRRHSITLLGTVEDLFGNAMYNNRTYYFTTAFEADGVAPTVVTTSFPDGQTDVPLNAVMAIKVDETINPFTTGGIKLVQNGAQVGIDITLSTDSTLISVKPKNPLLANTSYSLLIDQLADLSGNLLAEPYTVNFVAGIEADTSGGSIVNYSPLGYAEVASNVLLTARYPDTIDATSVTATSFKVYNETQARYINGSYSLSDNGRRVQFAADEWVVGNKYRSYLRYINDLAGNDYSASGWHYFTVVEADDGSAPALVTSNIVDGSTEIAINAPIKWIFSEALAAHCVSGDSVKLMIDGVETDAQVSLSSDRKQITVTPAERLSANTDYQLVASGLCDNAGNQLAQQSTNFTTSTEGTVDTSYPRLTEISPANTAVEVDVNSPIVMTFDEVIAPTNTAEQIRIYINGITGYIAGEFDYNGNVVTFTPLNPLPGNSQITVYLRYVRDIVGNGACCWSYSFNTESIFDTQAPQVVSITPADGAMDIGVNTPIVLTFNESLNGATVNNTNFKVYNNGNLINPSVYRSPDSRTVILRGTWPAGQPISVLVTDEVKDLSNNRLVDYASVFSSAVVDTDSARPSVVRQYPGSGSTNVFNVDRITLYTSELMDETTLFEAFHVAQNGIAMAGQARLSSSGQAVTFTPDAPFENDAIIHVYVDSNAKDDSGNAMNHYQGNFKTASLNSVGIRPTATTYVPTSGSTGVMVNSQIQIAYNQSINETFVNETYINLRIDGGVIVPAQITLSEDQRLVNIKPDVLLTANTYYYVSMSYAIEDTDGEQQRYNRSYSFTTGADAIEDTQRPLVSGMSPGHGMENVALNPRYQVHFDEPINTLSVTKEPSISMAFSADNQQMMYMRYAPLAANTEHTETIAGITDLAGNAVVSHTESFTTGEFADITIPNFVSYLPESNSTVAPNTPVVWQMTEVIDALSLNDNTIYVKDTSISGSPKVAGSASVSADGQTLTWVADQGLLVGRRYYAVLGSVTDLSGNVNGTDAYYFTTDTVADNTAPELSLTSVTQGMTEVATNARVRLRFNEAINKHKLAGITLSYGGEVHPVRYDINTDRTEVTLIPVSLLPAQSQITLSIADVTDISGNLIVASALNFTTEVGIDTAVTSIVNFSPVSNSEVASNVKLTLNYGERMDFVSVNSNSFKVYNNTQGRYVTGNYSLDQSASLVHFSPETPWTVGDNYRYYVRYLRDLAGNSLSASGWHYFTVVATDDVAAPVVVSSNIVDGMSNIAVNAPLKFKFDEALGAHCVNSNTVQLLLDGVAVETQLVLSTDRQQITLTPGAHLSAGGSYQLVVDGLCDNSGNQLAAQSTHFTVSVDGTVDTAYPRLSTISPTNGETDVDVNSPIVMTFDEAIAPTATPDEIRVYVSGTSGYIAGDFDFNDNVVTFTPLNALPGSSQITVYLRYVRDIVGNGACCWSYTFNTQSVFDTQAPQVVSITPADGAMDIGVNTPVVLRFNESLNAATATNSHFKIYSNGNLISPSVYRASDNRTVTLRGTWPAGQAISVIVTDQVKDLSNNAMVDYASVFTTAVVDTDAVRPSVVRQYPSSGATNVSNVDKVTLYTSELMDASSLDGAFHVAQNGVLMSGVVELASSGQAMTFTPNTPFLDDALIHVYLESSAIDDSGNPVNHYQGNFITDGGATAGVRPTPTTYIPSSGQTEVMINAQLQVAYNQALDQAFINETYVNLRIDGGIIVPAQLSLSTDKKIITIEPDGLLQPSTYYYVSLDYRIEDTDGDYQRYNRSYSFTTAQSAAEDTQQPMVIAMSPGNGAQNVALNPRYRVRFDEPINSLSAQLEENMSVWFGADSKEILYLRHQPLAANAEHAETVLALTDLAGNPLVPHTESFTTGEFADVVIPNFVSYVPESNQTVATNVSVVWQMDEVIDALSLNNNTVYVKDTNISGSPKVAGSASLSTDGRTITWIADDVLPVGRRFYAVLAAVTDLSGNINGTYAYYFHTTTTPDLVAPVVSQTSVFEGLADVATNTRVRVLFDESINKQQLTAVTLSVVGASEALQSRYELNAARTELTVIPVSLLPANSDITLTIAGIKDLSGNEVIASSINFTTEVGTDTTANGVISFSPAANGEIATNGMITVDFGERVDVASVNATNFKVYNDTQGRYVTGTYRLENNGRHIRFTALSPSGSAGWVEGDKYRFYMRYLRDLAGNSFPTSGWHYFTVTGAADVDAPQVASANISDGMTDIAVNAPFKLSFNEALAAHCVNNNTVQLLRDGVAVDATVVLSGDRKQITLTPTEHLSAGGHYQLMATGLCDTSNNQLAQYTSNFTVSASDVADTAYPQLSEILPVNGSTEVAVNSQIVLTFNEPVAATNTLEQIRVYVNGTTGYIAGDFDFNGNVVTFTPLNPLPGNSVITVYLRYVRDIVGNGACCWSYNFTTQSVFDSQAPQVVSVTPADGSMDIGANTPVVLSFNESLNGATVNNSNFKVYSNGSLISPSVYRSIDSRTVTLRGTWPSGQAISVVVSSDVKDLSNNAMVDYVSLFSTAVVDTDNNRPSVVRQYPGSGATNVTNVDQISLYTSELMDESSLQGAFNVAQNGVLVTGQVALASSGQVITFTPDSPFVDKALIHIYLDATALDDSGNALNNYQGNFTMAGASNVGVRPTPGTYIPNNGSLNVMLNPQIQIAYNQAMNEAFINETYISLRVDGGALVPALIALSADKQVVNITPNALLTASTYYYVSLDYRIEDTDGDYQRYNRSFGFTTGIDDVEDTQRPMVTAMSPGNNIDNVALNPRYRVRFDEPINSLSAQLEGDMSVWFGADNQEVLYLRHAPLVANTEHTETITTITDLAGNEVVPHSEVFTTGIYADVTVPNFVSYLPESNSTVATNTSVVWQFNEVIDALSLNTNTVYVKDTSLSGSPKVAGSAQLSADGRTITWVADAQAGALLPDRRYYAVVAGVTDLSGNVNSTDAYYFTTGPVADNAAPTVSLTSIEQGLSEVPTNARIRVRFDEAINKQQLAGVMLADAAQSYPVRYELGSGNTELTVIPVSLLPVNTELTLTIAGIKDISGNQIVGSTLGFSTGASVDTHAKALMNTSPYGNAVVSPNGLVSVQYGERIDAVSVSNATFKLYNQTKGLYDISSFSLSDDGKAVVLTPAALIVGDQYRYYISNLRDLAGNTLSATGWHYFTVAQGNDFIAPTLQMSNITDGSEIAINVPIKLSFSEALAAHCLYSDTVALRFAGENGEKVAVQTSISTDRRLVTITPSSHLAAAASYQLVAEGLCDVAGNKMATYTLNFSTQASGTVDNIAAKVVSITPDNQSQDQASNTEIVVTFDEFIDPLSIGVNASNSAVRIYTGSTYYPGDFSVTGSEVTFIAAEPFPASTKITVYLYNVRDLVGNRHCCTAMEFTTAP
ncbi:MAG: methionine-rich copper-binding protein CopC [Phenylobacterium sp.]|jgi:methionine-rich copper-binding protein CopC